MAEGNPQQTENDVKAPNLLGRGLEEIQAVMHTAKSHPHAANGSVTQVFNEAKAHFERAKEEVGALIETIQLKKVPNHTQESSNKETQGTSTYVDENPPLDDVNVPNILEGAREEVESLIGAIHLRKEADDDSSSKEEAGFWSFLARKLEQFCSPLAKKRD